MLAEQFCQQWTSWGHFKYSLLIPIEMSSPSATPCSLMTRTNTRTSLLRLNNCWTLLNFQIWIFHNAKRSKITFRVYTRSNRKTKLRTAGRRCTNLCTKINRFRAIPSKWPRSWRSVRRWRREWVRGGRGHCRCRWHYRLARPRLVSLMSLMEMGLIVVTQSSGQASSLTLWIWWTRTWNLRLKCDLRKRGMRSLTSRWNNQKTSLSAN